MEKNFGVSMIYFIMAIMFHAIMSYIAFFAYTKIADQGKVLLPALFIPGMLVIAASLMINCGYRKTGFIIIGSSFILPTVIFLTAYFLN